MGRVTGGNIRALGSECNIAGTHARGAIARLARIDGAGLRRAHSGPVWIGFH